METSKPTTRRAASLDALRGLAAVMVLVCHVVLFAPPLPPAAEWALRYTPLYLVASARAPVVFFFVLSGYVLTLSLLRPGAPGPVGFALSRACRLLLPVAGAVLLSAALRRIGFTGPLPDVSWYLRDVMWAPAPGAGDLLRQSLLLGADGQFGLDPALWSLVHEWRVSLVLPAVLLFRHRPLLLLALGLLAQGLAFAGGADPDRTMLGRNFYSTLVATLHFSAAFAAGASLALGGAGLRLGGGARSAAWVALPGCAWLHSDLAYIGGSLLLILLARDTGRLARLLARPIPAFLGRISYSLYLVHMPVLAFAAHATQGWLRPWVALGLGALVSPIVAVLFHAVVEVPSHRLSRELGRWGPRPRVVRIGSPAQHPGAG
jgi:peptidoglycan/LPS O-acetylase OafA/YrhL